MDIIDRLRCWRYNRRLPTLERELREMWLADSGNPDRPKEPPRLGRLTVADMRWGREVAAKVRAA